MTNGDSIGNGRAINQFTFRNDDKDEDQDKIDDPHASMKGKLHIIYVNGDYKDDKSEIGKLIHDFKCSNPDDMYYTNLAARSKYLKGDPKGVEEMCKIMDDLRKQTEKAKAVEIALKMLQTGKYTHEEIADMTGLLLNDVKVLAGKAAS